MPSHLRSLLLDFLCFMFVANVTGLCVFNDLLVFFTTAVSATMACQYFPTLASCNQLIGPARI